MKNRQIQKKVTGLTSLLKRYLIFCEITLSATSAGILGPAICLRKLKFFNKLGQRQNKSNRINVYSSLACTPALFARPRSYNTLSVSLKYQHCDSKHSFLK